MAKTYTLSESKAAGLSRLLSQKTQLGMVPNSREQVTRVSVFPVRLTQTGGSAGTSSAQCSFTYTVKELTNTNTLGTSIAMTGNGNRVVNAAMTAGTYGMAYYDETGTLKLIFADERISQTNCT